MAKSKREASAADLALWRKVTEAVTPLKRRPLPLPRAAVPVVPPEPGTRPPRTLVDGSAAPRVPAKPPARHGPLEPGRLVDVDRRTGERLRRGRMEIDATLDLHGLTQARAHLRLTRFVQRARAQGQRCLLVVTGKGRNGPDSGVLRRAVPLWLNDPDLRPLVIAVTPAQPQHGGAGALYVLLRRQR
ncbi:MAG: Smr/MutS family protein [Rhodospirillales bacterium]